MRDETIPDVWKDEDAISAKHNHDVKRLVEHLRAAEKASGHKVADLHARRVSERQATR